MVKLLEKMRRNPCDWRIQQIATVAKQYQVTIRKTSGSHVILSHPDWIELLSIPAHRPIKPIYIKKFIKLIELLE
jgi:predicted RNA binding protein YcfA (HicA-like mRNA interferase family)